MNAKFDDGKDPDAMRTIGEVAKALGIKPHVLRYWEQQFPTLRPLKGKGGRRHYRREDIILVEQIHTLVNEDGYTLKGARKVIETSGTDAKVPDSKNSESKNSDNASDAETAAETGEVKANSSRLSPAAFGASTDQASNISQTNRKEAVLAGEEISVGAMEDEAMPNVPFALPDGAEIPQDGGVKSFFGQTRNQSSEQSFDHPFAKPFAHSSAQGSASGQNQAHEETGPGFGRASSFDFAGGTGVSETRDGPSAGISEDNGWQAGSAWPSQGDEPSEELAKAKVVARLKQIRGDLVQALDAS